MFQIAISIFLGFCLLVHLTHVRPNDIVLCAGEHIHIGNLKEDKNIVINPHSCDGYAPYSKPRPVIQ